MASRSSSDPHAKGEELWDESLFVTPDQIPHISAFKEPLLTEDSETDSVQSTESRRSSAEEAIDSLKTHAQRLLKRSGKALRRSASLLSIQREEKTEWVKARDGVADLGDEDVEVIQQALDAANDNCSDGTLYFRKVPEDEGGDQVYWQVKFDHKKRSCFESAATLEDAATKIKSFLDYREPGELDERFKGLSEYISNDKRFNGAIVLFKEGKSKDYYPWKVRIHHETNGFTKRAETLEQAIRAMEEHVQYEKVIPENQQGDIWEKIFSALKNHRKAKVFYKEVCEQGPDGEEVKSCHMKVDHPIRGIQFEAIGRTTEGAAEQVNGYLEKNKKPIKSYHANAKVVS